MNAPTPTTSTDAGTIVALSRDLMFGSRISSAARSIGRPVRFVRDLPALAAAIDDHAPALVVIDMNGPLDWPAVAILVASLAGAVPVVGFGPHVDVQGRRAARQAGLTRIVSNGEFHRDTAGLLARYARS